MDIAKQFFKVIFVGILLLFTSLVFRQPHAAYYDASDEYIYSTGNAAPDVRAAVKEQLDKFQAGYTQRDLDQVDAFMEALFSQQNLLVLGTMPDEVFVGYEDVSELI